MNNNSKLNRKITIQESSLYKTIKTIAICMDKYYLDPIIGIFPIVGDVLSWVFVLPFIYISLFKIRSIPLTLAVLYYSLIDVLIGIIPFWIGDICDIFYKSNLKNFKLIKGFVEDDPAIIKKVNKNAVFMAIAIIFILLLICLVVLLLKEIWMGSSEVIMSLYHYLIGIFS